MRYLLFSAFIWQVTLSDRRILENYEKKLNAREGQVVGGMVKRYRCIEEYVPVEEAGHFGKSGGIKKKAHGIKTVKVDGIKPRKSKVKQTEKVENVEATLKVKSPEEKAIDEEIEKLLHESDGPTTPTSPVNPIRPQKRREPDQKTITNLFDHEMSRGVPISEFSQNENGKRQRYQGRQFYVYDFNDEETEYDDEDYYDDRIPRRRIPFRRRHYAPARRNMFYYPQRLPYRAAVRGQGAYIPLQSLSQQQPLPQQQSLPQYSQQMQPQQPLYLQRRQPVAFQPLPVARQAGIQPIPFYGTRTPMSTVAPAVILEPAERVDPAISLERRAHPQRPIHPRLKLNALPRAAGVEPTPTFNKGQLEEATPENCRKITQLSSQFGIKDISTWSRGNCPTLQMFVPGATCQQLWHFIDSCHKRKFL